MAGGGQGASDVWGWSPMKSKDGCDLACDGALTNCCQDKLSLHTHSGEKASLKHSLLTTSSWAFGFD